MLRSVKDCNSRTKNLAGRKEGRKDGWVDGRMDVKAGLRIAYSNDKCWLKKPCLRQNLIVLG